MSYGRWSTNEEIISRLDAVKQDSIISKGGIPIAYDDSHLYIDSSENHTLVIGSTGSGKTQAVILPSLNLSLRAGESVFVNDPKGEIYEKVLEKLKQENYETILLNFSDPNYGNNWNPLHLPYQLFKNGNQDAAMKMLEEIGYYLLNEEKPNTSDPFWINSARNYFTGLVMYLFENASEEEINLKSVEALNNKLENEEFTKKLLENVSTPIYLNLKGTLKAPKETKGSILSVFYQQIAKYLTKTNLSNMLMKSDFDITSVQKEKTAIFIVGNESDSTGNLIPLLFNQIVDATVLFKTDNRRLNVLFDEFDRLVPIKDFNHVIAFCRSEKIKITVCIQSFAHLLNMYSKEEVELLKMCFGNIIYLLSQDIYTLEEIVRYCGNKNENGQTSPLITVEELKTLRPFEAIVLMPRMLPCRTKMLPSYTIDWGYKSEKKEFPKRKPVAEKIYNA